MAGALNGIRVIDFGQYLAGPLAALLLADQGAEVIRVDPPDGPRWRHPANAVLQRGKRSIVLDLKCPNDLAIARDLVALADVVIENFRPGVMERLGLGPLATTERHRHLIFCSLPGFAADDPRAGLAGWEGVVSASAGLYYPRLPAVPADPIYSAVPLASSYAAFIAAHSIVAALIARHRGGFGQHIEVALFDAAFQVMGREAQIVNGVPVARERLPINRAVIKRHRCGDGRWVDISPPLRGFGWFAERYLPQSALASGIADIFNADPAASTQLAELLSELFQTRSAAVWERAVNDETGAPMALCQTSAEWLRDEHARASRCVIPLADPELGPTWQAGYPIALSRTPPRAQGPRHGLDADREAILEELAARPRPASPAAPSAIGPRPLDGFLVLDLSQILAGPTACRVLAEYGAEVVKINNPRPENPLATTGHTFVNNGKRTLLLDLKAPQGRELMWRLVARADVFHQNFVRGLPERLGLDEASLRRRRPDIVYSSVNTHADGGFRAGWRGHEELGQAVTGMQTRLGGAGEPARAGWPACDYGTGHLSAFAILVALYYRLRSGESQHVQASLSGTGTYLQIPFMVDFAGRRWDEPSGLAATGWGPLYRLYKGSDRWFFLAAQQPGELARLAMIEGLHGVDRAPASELPALLAERFAAVPAGAWVARLTAAGLSAQVARDVHENMADPVHIARGLSILRDHPGLGRICNVGRSRRFSRTPVDPLFAAPPLGCDSRAIIDETGWGARFSQLVADGIVAEKSPAGTPPGHRRPAGDPLPQR
jgi:crotonobetainyl-CoA:carnitine CoA-transferase CaiB-like acyl-CoA transferase